MRRFIAFGLVLIPGSVLVAGGCAAPTEPPIEITDPAQAQLVASQSECDSDDDCFHTGCSNQLCASQDIVTTCEFTCEYGCYQEATCGCKGHKCAFDKDTELKSCLRACKKGGEEPIPCGGNTCGAGEYCCNESCGICAPIGGGCIQIVCG